MYPFTIKDNSWGKHLMSGIFRFYHLVFQESIIRIQILLFLYSECYNLLKPASKLQQSRTR